MEYVYYCPTLRLNSIKKPCDIALNKAKEAQEAKKALSYTFQKCLECGGLQLQVKEVAPVIDMKENVQSLIEPIFIGKKKEQIPYEVANKIHQKLQEDPGDTKQNNIPMCPKHPENPQKKNKNGIFMGMCLTCLQERAQRSGKAVVKINKTEQRIEKPKSLLLANPTCYAQDMLFRCTLESLPVFDPTWTQEVWSRWERLWGYLWDIARDLDGVDR